MHYDKMLLGNKIYHMRTKLGLKQIDIANFLNISQSTYSKIETGKSDITLETLYKICDYFNTNITYLISVDNELTNDEMLDLDNYRQYLIFKRSK